jgi:hypothetical protein
MMRKLLVLTAVAVLVASAIGCQCCDWFRRGAMYPATPAPVMCDPCCPADPGVAPCDPCAPATYGMAPATYGTAPATVLPGPGPLPPG